MLSGLGGLGSLLSPWGVDGGVSSCDWVQISSSLWCFGLALAMVTWSNIIQSSQGDKSRQD